MRTFEADRHRRSPSCVILGYRGRAYPKSLQMKICDRTQEPLVFARVDTNVAPADLASGRTRQIGAEYRSGVHDDSPLLVVLGSMPRRSMSGPPLPLQPHSTTV